jgi:HNH endonuclease
MSRKPSVECYLCGKWSNSHTKEHVPPEMLGGGVKGIAYIYVPACRVCNNQFSHEESKLRDLLSVIGSNTGVEAADGAFAAFARSVNRQPGIINRDLQRILENISITDMYSGKIWVGKAQAIQTPRDLDAACVIKKIARGLHYYHTQQVIPQFYQKHGALFDSSQIPAPLLTAQYPYTGQTGDFFHYGGWTFGEKPDMILWIMAFYKRAYGVAWFQDPSFDITQHINEINQRLLLEKQEPLPITE